MTAVARDKPYTKPHPNLQMNLQMIYLYDFYSTLIWEVIAVWLGPGVWTAYQHQSPLLKSPWSTSHSVTHTHLLFYLHISSRTANISGQMQLAFFYTALIFSLINYCCFS